MRHIKKMLKIANQCAKAYAGYISKSNPADKDIKAWRAEGREAVSKREAKYGSKRHTSRLARGKLQGKAVTAQ